MMVNRFKAGVGAAQGSPVLAHSPEEFGAYRSARAGRDCPVGSMTGARID
jgi:hypothetical protein